MSRIYAPKRKGKSRDIPIGLLHCSILYKLPIAHSPLLHAHVQADAALDLLQIKAELVGGGVGGEGGARIGGG